MIMVLYYCVVMFEQDYAKSVPCKICWYALYLAVGNEESQRS